MYRFRFLAAAALAAAALWLFPLEQKECADLIPAETLLVTGTAKEITVRVSEDLSGTGDTLTDALKQLERAAPGTVFYGTVDYVVIADSAEAILPEITECEELRPGTALVALSGETEDVEALTAYLRAHEPEVTIADRWRRGKDAALPTVYAQMKGGFTQ